MPPALKRGLLIAAAASVVGCGNTYVVPSKSTQASATTSDAGATLELTEDLVIDDGSDWEMAGTPDARCTIRGNGHTILTSVPWTGHFAIRNCDIIGLGTADQPGILLNMHGTSSADIEGCVLDASGQVRVLNYEASTVTFARNKVLATSLVPAVPVVADSTPAFQAQVTEGTGHKVFQGNVFLHSYAAFQGSNWLVGGNSAAEGNVFVGVRAGLFLEGTGIVVRGNYVHTIFPTSPDFPHGQEVAPFTLLSGPDLLVEHNVFRHGHWVIRGVAGEVRYNAILDADDTDWIREPMKGCKMHHNVFANYLVPGEETGAASANPSIQGGIEVINYAASGVEMWANTFDGGGPGRYFSGPTISIASGSAVDSVRSNLFMRFVYGHGAAALAMGADEMTGTPPVLGYADYNLFDSPGGDTVDNYALPVAGKVERMDAGFGAHDVPALGAKDAQVDPQVTGPLAAKFPWTDDAILAGTVTVHDMLTYFRSVYAPRAGSPLIDAGDPQDGAGADIGAIGAGAANENDHFGDLPAGIPAATQLASDAGVAGVAPSSSRPSDGSLALRCSLGALGRSTWATTAATPFACAALALLVRLTFVAGSGPRRRRRATRPETSGESRST
jgi:hypothetical protein